MDDAFTRRFQTVVHFPMPRPSERLRLWEKAFPKAMELSEEINLRAIADRYEIAGGAITNVIRYCAMAVLRRKSNIVLLADLEEGIRREFRKEGKSI
jgi:ATP-dependent 26S proteasome regulatory subunit